MTSFETEVDVTTVTDQRSGVLAVILTHRTGADRLQTENLLLTEGGTRVEYPSFDVPASPIGNLVLCDELRPGSDSRSMSLFVGPLHIVGYATSACLPSTKKAILLVNDRDHLDLDDKTPRRWVAAPLSLDFLERNDT